MFSLECLYIYYVICEIDIITIHLVAFQQEKLSSNLKIPSSKIVINNIY